MRGDDRRPDDLFSDIRPEQRVSMDDAVWGITVFTKNRERLLRGDVAERPVIFQNHSPGANQKHSPTEVAPVWWTVNC